MTVSFAPDDRPQGIAEVEVAVFDGEAVLFDATSSMVHHLNAVPAATWLCCDGETTVAEMLDELIDVFSATEPADIETLTSAVHESLARFATEGLLVGRRPESTARGLDRPLGRDDVDTTLVDGEFVVAEESTGTVHRLNSTAGAVWSLCDGETSPEAMAQELGEIFGLEPAVIIDDIRQALDQLGAAGLLVGVDAALDRHHADPNEVLVADGSRMLVAPPDT